jgi:excisionase family DNA binding protein
MSAAIMADARLLTVEEAAAELHATVTVRAIRDAIRSGALAATRIGRRYYVTPEALRRFARCPAPASRPGSTSAPIAANGSSATMARPYGQVLAEAAAEALRKPPLRATSPGAAPSAVARLRPVT